jgi:phosphoribosylformimino-5-aminoimidazole carboxamide ribonucleotide (ProFAR) isomerase
MADLEALKIAGDGLLEGVISGRALYDGHIELGQAVELMSS